MRSHRLFTVARVVGTAILLAGPLQAQSVAIIGGTVHPVSGPPIEGATVLIRDGRIEAIGRDVAIPAGAERIDAAGRWVTPGFIHAASNLGVEQFSTGAVQQTRDNRASGDVNPSFAIAEGIEPDAIPIPVARLEGVTSAVALPTGGLISGQAALFDLSGSNLEEMLVKAPAAMVVRLGLESKASGGGTRAGTLARLRQLLLDAREYDRRRDDYRKGMTQALSANARELEALLPVLRGEVPMLVLANRASDIESALRLAREFQVRVAILGGLEAWRVAPLLSATGTMVVLEPRANLPSFDALQPRLDNAALLRKAGVVVAVVSSSDRTFGSTLRHAAGTSVAYGMAWEDALMSVTLAPATLVGVQDRYGTLQPGKVANVVVWSGDPFEFTTRAEHVFIRGKAVPQASRQMELLRRYRQVP